MARTTQDISKSVPQIQEELVLGGTGIRSGATALLALAQVPVKGLYVISFTAAIASVAAAITVVQEYSITDSGHAVRVAVGDLFIPFAPALIAGTGAGAINAGLAFTPCRALTIDKAPLQIVNVTAGALDPNDTLTVTALWIKTV